MPVSWPEKEWSVFIRRTRLIVSESRRSIEMAFW